MANYFSLNREEIAKFDFTTKITEDITLEARWTKNDVKKWVVTFDTDGANSIDALNVEDGKTIIDVPTPTKEGYKFEGWYLNNKKYDFNKVITSDITLTAKWKKLEKYTVTFNTDGGSSVTSQKIIEGKKARLKETIYLYKHLKRSQR